VSRVVHGSPGGVGDGLCVEGMVCDEQRMVWSVLISPTHQQHSCLRIN
jgi:hypothetical protein